MAVLTKDDLKSQLTRHVIAPVYLLFGPETYLRDNAAQYITDLAFADGDFRDFNDTNFSLNTEDNLTRALAVAEQLPMMASRRVVRVTDIRISATGYRDTLTEQHESLLSAYLTNPSPTSVVLLIADELNGVRKMSKLLKDNATAVEFKPLADDELLKWASDEFKKLGTEIDVSTLNQFIARVGPDVRHLTNEINKLATAALPGRVITRDLVAQLVPNTREISNFDFTDHLIAGRGAQALTALRKTLDDGAEPLALLGSIAYNYRRLLTAKEMMSRGVDRREVASAVKLFGRGQDDFLAAARRASMANLVSAIQSLAKTDLAIKTSKGGGGPVGARLQIEMLVCELAGV